MVEAIAETETVFQYMQRRNYIDDSQQITGVEGTYPVMACDGEEVDLKETKFHEASDARLYVQLLPMEDADPVVHSIIDNEIAGYIAEEFGVDYDDRPAMLNYNSPLTAEGIDNLVEAVRFFDEIFFDPKTQFTRALLRKRLVRTDGTLGLDDYIALFV